MCRDPTVGFQSSGSGYREIWTRRIRIWRQKLPNLSVRCLKWENRNFLKFIFGFLVIAPTGSLGFGPDLVGIFPRSLPQLSKQLRDQNNRQKPQKQTQNFKTFSRKITIDQKTCFSRVLLFGATFSYFSFVGPLINRRWMLSETQA